MRRYIFLLILSVCFISVEAQEWACDSLASSISIFNKLSSNGNKKWAEKLMPDFPLNTDGEIELNYVFNCSDTISRSDLRNLTEGWIATVYSKPESVIKRSDSERLVCNGELG